jgi:S1-C subfamily serine protease
MDEMNENLTPPQGGEAVTPGAGAAGPGGWAPAGSSADPGGPTTAEIPGAGSGGWQWSPPPPPPGDDGARGAGGGRRMLVLVVVVALLAGILGAGLDAALRSSPTPSGTADATSPTTSSGIPLAGGQAAVAQVAAAVDPAVVDITTDVANQVATGAEQAEGTGMIITPSGEVLTNNHVVADATNIRATVAGHGTYKVKVLGVDVNQDVALVQLVGAPKDLPYVQLGNSASVQVGAPVVAIGNALGLGGRPTVISGAITAVGRTITANDAFSTTTSETLHNLLQTDAPIVSGDSGGPLVNLKDQVIGMDTAAQSAEATGGTEGFAIPINEAHNIALQIMRGKSSKLVHLGETAFLGVLTGEAPTYSTNPFGFPTGSTGPTSTPAGVYISAVYAATPALRAGLQAGDTITAVDGTATKTNAGLLKAIESHQPGAQITVTYVDSGGTSHTVRAVLAGITR